MFRKGELVGGDGLEFKSIQGVEKVKEKINEYLRVLTEEDNYMPREYLLFLELDLALVERMMAIQESHWEGQKEPTEEDVLMDMVKRTDNVKEDLRQFLLKVLKREELYKVKVESY